MEWRALGEALETRGAACRRAVRDALLFRAHRLSRFPGAAEAERSLELYEGLAEYTGLRASATSEAQAITDALAGLSLAPQKPSFVRSFAYASGPAYGLLLDRFDPGWRLRVKAQPDLGGLLRKALAIRMDSAAANQVLERAAAYGLEDLVKDETRRESEKNQRMARFHVRLVDGPVLILPRSGSFRYSFDPNQLVPLGQDGTVYPTLQASDAWGTLEATEGALMAREDLRLPAPEPPSSRTLKGAGWTVTLQPGWTAISGAR